MNCIKFQSQIDDFIFDRINYLEDLESFVKHAHNCSSCYEELDLYYTIHKGLGDVPFAGEDEENTNPSKELENILYFYDSYFKRQHLKKKIVRMASIIVPIILVIIIILVILTFLNIF